MGVKFAIGILINGLLILVKRITVVFYYVYGRIKELKDLKIKKNLIIAYIVRNNVAIFPKGTDVINEGDRVIIITKESFFDDINNIVAE